MQSDQENPVPLKRGQVSSSAGRSLSIELLRIIAAYGIVAFHAGASGHDFAYAGLVVFLILSPYFECAINWARPRPPASTAKMYLVPWAFWCAFYGVLNVARGKQFADTDSVVTAVFSGTSQHLWFMPFMFFVIVMLNALKRHAPVKMVLGVSAALAALSLVSVTTWRPFAETLGSPYGQWFHALPVVFVGIAFGFTRLANAAGRIAIGTILFFGLLIAASSALPGISVPYLIGTMAVLIALRWPPHWIIGSAIIEVLGACTFGVYLSHPLWLLVSERLSGVGNHATVTVAFGGALISTWVAQRAMPWSRHVIGHPPKRRMQPAALAAR